MNGSPEAKTSFERVFGPEILQRLRSRARGTSLSRWLQPELAAVHDRAEVIASDGSDPRYAAYRAAWSRYLDAAGRVGLLDDPGLVAELRGANGDKFRGAMAECMTAWYFSQQLGHAVSPRAAGRDARRPDLFLRGGETNLVAEVKSPSVPTTGPVQYGNDAAIIRRCLERAGRQLSGNSGSANLVVVVPVLRTPVHERPDQLIEAVVGTWAWTVPVDVESGGLVGRVATTFRQDGKLARIRPVPELAVERTDLTRVSAVVVLEERAARRTDGAPELHVAATVAHNPFAAVPVDPALFGGVPQLVRHGDGMQWMQLESSAGHQT